MELNTKRLRQAGATPAEIRTIEAQWEALGPPQDPDEPYWYAADFSPSQQDLMDMFIQATDVRAWLAAQRRLYGGRFFQTNPEQARLDQELFEQLGELVLVTVLPENPAKKDQQIVASGASQLGGFAFMETTGTTGAKFIIRDGTSSAGKELFPITLRPNESTREVFLYGQEGSHGVPIGTGAIWLDWIEGEFEGMVIWL